MKNKVPLNIVAASIVLLLTGCSSLAIKDLPPLSIKDPTKYITEQKNPIFTREELEDKEKSHGLRILAKQVLGQGHECSKEPIKAVSDEKTDDTAFRPKYYEDKEPLSEDMAKAGTMKALIMSQCSQDGDMEAGNLGMREFIDAMHKEYVRAYADGDVQETISKAKAEGKAKAKAKAEAEGKMGAKAKAKAEGKTDAEAEAKEEAEAEAEGGLVFSKVLFTYAKAYYNGDFVLRDGTKLAKPSVVVGFDKDGVFSGSTDNDTLIGLTTVFLEAFAEFVFPTPVIVAAKKKPVYEVKYCLKNPKDSTSTKTATKTSANSKGEKIICIEDPQPREEDQLYELLYTRKKDDVTDYMNTSNLEPVVHTLKNSFFGKEVVLVEKGSKGISAVEFKAMRHISGNVADGLKMVLGTSLRSLGGFGVSFGGFGKISVGDNDALTKIVETAIEVLSRRLVEYRFYKLFKEKELESQKKLDIIFRD
ncbi:hypothetical protein [Nitrosospira sp. Nsp1]|uniref:hypothetical protein n=1 Tax=Nitrosospira sp. Nsp1 TaxID=136547 RepID=UPI00088AD224|nr:hypothetical protein [Nitrosospira sp. Nsp1]SCX61005.1 hypothetical protein SAMN05720354_12642 [Nitrosospira sp. Nsp1]